MAESDGIVHITSEQPERAAQLVRRLLALGFTAKVSAFAASCRKTIRPRDLLVVTGEGDAPETGWQLPTPSTECATRTIVFLSSLQPTDFAMLSRAGFRYLNTSPSASIENLVYLISQVDPDIVYTATKRRTLRAEASATIQSGVISLFQRLRAGAQLEADVAERQRREIDDLVGMTPMSVWLDLFQHYHDGTAQHCALVTGFALVFARKLGFGERDVGRLYDAAFFHDVGKAMILLEILDKPGVLMPVEREIMNRHVTYGYEILSRSERTAGEIARVARDHHEYLDGSGYPNGLRAPQIDDLTRVLTICDIFAALVEKRAYKAPKSPDEAYDIVQSMAGTKLDPDLVRLFQQVAEAYDVLDRLPTRPAGSSAAA